jgi:hypothetical protein
VYSYDPGAGSTWTYRAGYLTSISASTNDTVFGIDAYHGVWMNRGGTTWANLGIPRVNAICAGVDAFGDPEVYAIGCDGDLYGNIGGFWFQLGDYGYFWEAGLSATTDNTVVAIGWPSGNILLNEGSGVVNLGVPPDITL